MSIVRDNIREWSTIKAFGLQENDLDMVKEMVPDGFRLENCTGFFDTLIMKTCSCLIIKPDALTDIEWNKLNEVFEDDKNTIILFIEEPDRPIKISYKTFDPHGLTDSILFKIMRTLKTSMLPIIVNSNEEALNLDYNLSAGYVVIDIETSGVDADKHEITKISAVRIKKMKIEDRYESLVRIEGLLNENIENLTGITNEELLDAPELKKVMEAINNFYPLDPIVYYNSNFLTRFFDKAYERSGVDILKDKIIIDTTPLYARLYSPHFVEYSHRYDGIEKLIDVTKLSEYKKDVDVEAGLFINLLCVLINDYGYETVGDIRKLYN